MYSWNEAFKISISVYKKKSQEHSMKNKYPLNILNHNKKN